MISDKTEPENKLLVACQASELEWRIRFSILELNFFETKYVYLKSNPRFSLRKDLTQTCALKKIKL